MEAAARQPDPPIVEALLADAPRYGFFQAVRLLELCYPNATRLGTNGPAAGEAVRLRPDTSFAHPRSSVTAIRRLEFEDDPDQRIHVTEAMIGLYGLRSPMPSVYGEEILIRNLDLDEKDPVRALLDIFHHRFLSLLYRAWARPRAEALYRDDGGDALTWMLFCLMGVPHELLPSALPFHPLRIARYCAYFMRRARPAEGLEAMLKDALAGQTVRLEPYVRRSIDIPVAQQNRLGRVCSTLGSDVHLGARIPDVGTAFRLRIGPLRYTDYLGLAVAGDTRTSIGALVQLYVADGLDHELELGISGEEKPVCALGRGHHGVRLGVDTWLRSRKPALSWERFPALPRFGHAKGAQGMAA
jgi:type VI secretion system protein ImpH